MDVEDSRVTWTGVLGLIVLISPAAGGTSSRAGGEGLHAGGNALFVDAGVSGVGDGSSWAEAFTHLRDALAAADARNADGDPANDVAEVWVAAGAYMPDGAYRPRDGSHVPGGGDREAAFHWTGSLQLYGGFAGGETSLGQRDIDANETVLSGDLAGDDLYIACTSDSPDCDTLGRLCGENGYCILPANNGENSYHVIAGIFRGVIDGFTITAGNANGPYQTGLNRGGGLYVFEQVPELVSCVFTGNSAEGVGGAIYAGWTWDEWVVRDSCFLGNAAGYGGGAVNLSSSVEHATVVRCDFRENGAFRGGAIMARSVSARIEASRFLRNAAGFGGAISSEGEMVVVRSTFVSNDAEVGGGAFAGSGMLTQCRFSGNSARYGGGGAVYVEPPRTATVSNCSFAANLASTGGAVYFGRSADSEVVNSILWGNSPDEVAHDSGTARSTIRFSIVEGGVPAAAEDGGGNIDADPLWVDPIGPDGIAGTEDDDVRLLAGSPAINSGDNVEAASLQTDLLGHPRILCGVVDLGAYEFGIGDYTCDQVLDLYDFAAWEFCVTGPASQPYSPACVAFDFAFDGHFDLGDYAGIQLSW